MKEGERLRDFVQRFKRQLNTILDILPADVIETFKTVVRNEHCIADIIKERPITIAHLMNIVKTSGGIEDQLHRQCELDQGLRPSRRDNKNEKLRKQKKDDRPPTTVMAGFQDKNSAAKDNRSPWNKSKAKKFSASESKENN